MQKDYLLEFGIRANRLTPEESGNLNEKDLFNYNKKFYIFSRLGSYTPNKNEEEILTSNIKELLIRAINNNEDTPTLVRICALVWVDKESQKRMIIGDKGSKLKEMASQARLDMEKLLEKKVFLQCWCKVKSGWSDNESVLQALGYE